MSTPSGTLVAEAAALTPARKRWTLLAVILGSGIVFLDTSVVNLALPRIGEELSSGMFGTLEAQSYVANGYFVTLSALLILAGALSDYFGRRRMFAIGLVGFAATSLLCGISPTMEFLSAAVNGFGIRNPAPAGRHLGSGAEQPPPESGSGTPSGPVPVGAEEFGKQQPQADRTGPANRRVHPAHGPGRR